MDGIGLTRRMMEIKPCIPSRGIIKVNENAGQSTAVITDIVHDISKTNLQSPLAGKGSNQVQQNVQSLSALADQLQRLVQKFKVRSCKPGDLKIAGIS
jgi:hypothetical protein